MEQDDKRLEEFVNKLMNDDSIEQSPLGFTENVMTKIEALSEVKSSVYKPLIPKSVWWFIGASFIALLGYILFRQPSGDGRLLERYNLPDVSINFFEELSFDFSTSLMYAMIFLAIMLSIQIPLLKQYVSKHVAY